MILHSLSNYLTGINLGIEIACACLSLILFIAVIMKKNTSEEMRFYKYFIAAHVVSLWSDIIAYLVSGNKSLVTVLISMSILSYLTSGLFVAAFIEYLQTYYKTKYHCNHKDLHYILLSYVFACTIIYITSAWTGWFYYISPEYTYETGKYSALLGLFYLPLFILSFYVSFKHRKIATRRETVLHSLFSVLYIILSYIGAKYLSTIHYLNTLVFAFLIFIFISMEQEQELTKKETELIKSELNALRLQMNPHFIYNTLASIDGLCMFDPEEARKLIAKFTKHLRGSYLDNSPSTIPFEKELENLETYFAVEQVRFPDIEFVTDINVKDFEVPPLTIQPVFENAIKHGICGKEETEGTITLSTFEKDHCYHIVITDDGVGFDTSKKKEPDGRSHLGVENTKKRLELICGGQMITTSTIGVGTTVDMIIPKKENSL